MPVTELNHYFVRANDLERSRRFYCEVLGFEEMPRPNFPFPGYWLGVNGKIQVHMGPHGIPNSELYYLGCILFRRALKRCLDRWLAEEVAWQAGRQQEAKEKAQLAYGVAPEEWQAAATPPN